MDIRQLHYFVTIADEGGISAAARKLYMTQPPLSSQMSLLEKELGTPLFFRTYEGVRLTEAGKRLYRHARELLRLSEIAEEDVRSVTHGKSGILRIGMVSSVVGSYGIGWLSGFCRRFPEVTVQLGEANTYDLIEQIRKNLLRCAVVRTPFRDYGLPAIPVMTEKLIAIMPPDAESARPHSLSDLSARPLIIYRRWEQILRQTFEMHGLSMDVRCLCDDAKTAVSLAEEGLGICIAPASSLSLGKGDLCACDIGDLDIRSDIVLLTAADLSPDEPAWHYREFLRETVKAMPENEG